ncbi:unnamed protein product [Peniophora sp. CBMAI 1063]|nr:unnamed protein product [Peniophora sp. CBMAI 1063]
MDNHTPTRDKLFPTTPPHGNRRYSDKLAPPDSPRVTDISAAAHLSARHSAPAYTETDNWAGYTHPEGKIYHARGMSPRIVTEVDVKSDAILRMVNAYVGLIFGWASELELELGSSIELFVEPLVASGACGYYLVDHGSRVIFWLQDCSVYDLKLPDASSPQNLKLVLEENYWIHVELFSMHITELPGALDELIAVYLHGRADLATSTTSTFPYSTKTADDHLDVLMRCRSMPTNPMTFTIIARLWSVIANVRYRNLYGEEYSRLDRTIWIYDDQPKQPRLGLRYLSVFMFGLPNAIRKELDEQVVDGIMIACVWSTFIERRIVEWQTTMNWTFALIICSGISVTVSPVPVLPHISFALTTAGLLSSTLLQHRFKSLAGTDAVDDACAFMREQKGQTMILAIVFSFPRAALIWGLVLLASQAIFVVFRRVALSAGIIICMLLFSIALCTGWCLYPSYRLTCFTPNFTLPGLPYGFLSQWSRRVERIRDAEHQD